MKILITGAAGFIGSHLVDRLLQDGHHVLGLDNFNEFYDPKLKERNLKTALANPNFELIKGDICDAELVDSVFSSFKPKRLVHLAAWAGVRPSIETPAIYSDVNLGGTVNLFQACVAHGVDRVCFASSSSVYGDRQTVPFTEEDDVSKPISPYAATKRSGELLAYTWHHLFKLHIHCLRFFTVYGPRQRPEMAIAKFVNLIEADQTIEIYGDGHSARDYTYIDDIIDGVIQSIEHVDGYGIYNLGNSVPTKLLDLVNLIGLTLGKEPRLSFQPNQPGDVSITYADLARSKTDLGYQPKTSMKAGIAQYVEWYRRIHSV
ncbi:MAG: GDP-mannose 4,6-dehydratase [Myxococcota bacterium]|nr:GDP-mannose 4,6-dehydratase [Myxococcota bacterium]